MITENKTTHLVTANGIEQYLERYTTVMTVKKYDVNI